jgi:PPM family protein phosphatase
MIRVADYVSRTDTGHQRTTNEDAHLARTPVFVIADGMGGAQAGEVASQLAIAHFADGLPGEETDAAEQRLAQAVQDANAEIHALSESDARRAGMGTTLTAAYVGPHEIAFAHVGDSRAYLLRDGELERITEDHSLVEELLRQGRLTEEEAEEHPQRSIITRALGPEPDVDVDTFTRTAVAGDVYLICSDGLTSMVSEATVGEIMRDAADIAAAAERLVAAALEAGGRDNVTVVLFRIEEVAGTEAPTESSPAQPPRAASSEDDLPQTQALAPALLPSAPDKDEPGSDNDAPGGVPADDDDGNGSAGGAERAPAAHAAPPPADSVSASPVGSPGVQTSGFRRHRRAPRMPSAQSPRRRSRLRRRAAACAVLLAVVGVLALAAVLATQSVYFIGTDSDGQVTVYNGVPYTLPGGVRLYTPYFVSGVTAAELSRLERRRLFNNELRSQRSATNLVAALELDRIAGQ